MDKKNISFVDQLSNHIIEWVNKNKDDFSIIGGISHEDQKDINRLFNANFKTIMASPHFDEFLIRQEGGWIWKSIEGRIATDFRNVVNKTLGLNRETESLYFCKNTGCVSKFSKACLHISPLYVMKRVTRCHPVFLHPLIFVPTPPYNKKL